MKSRIVRVEVSKTIQQVQYEPLKVSVALEGEVADNEDLNKETEEALLFCREQVNEEILSWIE